MIIYVGNKKTYLALRTVKALIRNNNLSLCKYNIIHNVVGGDIVHVRVRWNVINIKPNFLYKNPWTAIP